MEYRIPLREWVSSAVEFLSTRLDPLFGAFSDLVLAIVDGLKNVMMAGHPLLVTAIIALITFRMAGWRAGALAAGGLLLIGNIGLWASLIETLALVLAAEVLIMVVGLPLGILAARDDRVNAIIRPALDFMQTMPAFVYLIPAVMFFGIGLVPGVVATFVFAIPPLIRLTNLGIRQVPNDLIEAAEAFGAKPLQMLVKVQLPVALPTVMAGVNQSIMLGLSMVVIAGMIGAGGLGADVLTGIQRLQVGQGFEAGLAVVILAIILDRITAGFAGKQRKLSG